MYLYGFGFNDIGVHNSTEGEGLGDQKLTEKPDISQLWFQQPLFPHSQTLVLILLLGLIFGPSLLM